MPTEKEALDYLGEFLMKHHRDRALFTLEKAFEGEWQARSLQGFQAVLQDLSGEQRDKLYEGFESIISGTLHDLLFNLQEENNSRNRVKLTVDGHDAVKISDGLHGEQYGEDGWIERFSKYKKKK
jgi:hypothetical protein